MIVGIVVGLDDFATAGQGLPTHSLTKRTHRWPAKKKKTVQKSSKPLFEEAQFSKANKQVNQFPPTVQTTLSADH